MMEESNANIPCSRVTQESFVLLFARMNWHVSDRPSSAQFDGMFQREPEAVNKSAS